MKPIRKMLIPAIIICLLFPVTGLADNYLSFDQGLTFLGNSVPGTSIPGSAIHPITYGAGLSAPFFLTKNMFIKTALFFTATPYLYNGGKAIPAVTEYRELLVLFSNLDILWGVNLILSPKTSLEFSTGPAVILRWPFPLNDEVDTTGALRSLYEGLRFLSPVAETALKWDIENNLGLLFTLKTRVPLYHLWNVEESSWIDQWQISGTVGVVYTFRK